MDHLVSGAAFGAALTASGVFQPTVILGQLQFQNFQMIQTFLTATGTSAFLVTIARQLNLLSAKPRSFSPIGLFAPYDGNILGGALLGAGMLLSGACPGTVFAQIGLGVRSGFYALEGATIAGIVWTGLLHPLIQKRLAAADKSAAPPPTTLASALGISHAAAVATFSATCAALVYAAATLAPAPGPEAKFAPPLGGLFIVAAQLVSILLRGSLMGTSSSFEEVGDWFWGVTRGKSLRPARYANVLYTAGMVGGAWLLGKTVPALAQVTPVEVAPLAAGLGGFMMVLGARMAGGCTSGHGISGLSLMSTSSALTIGTAFVTAGVLGVVMG
ncbi:hypothetical protein QBC39DRAFT_266732 [Podospora conica]|nr:hypothetical protein QBC39DRAFT_266732 [Schizothecium conicum]